MLSCRVLLPLLIVLGWTRGVYANPEWPPMVGELLDEGFALREQGRDQEALAKFQAAHALHPTPRTVAQIALAEQALGRWVEAREHLKKALSFRDHRWISDNTEALHGALVTIEAELGRLEIRCNVDGAQVRIGGRDLGRTPLAEPAWAGTGTVNVQISAEGYQSVLRTVSVRRGALSRTEISLVKAASKDAAASPASPVSGQQANGGAHEAHANATRGLPGETRKRDPRWLYGAGAGAVLELTAALIYRKAGARASEAESRCDEDGCSSSELDKEIAAIDRLDRTSWALAAIGGAAALGSLAGYLWLKRPAQPAFDVGVARDAMMVRARIGF